MNAEMIARGMQAHHPATSDRSHRNVGADRMLALAVIAIALVAAMLLAMVPGFAGVRVDGSAVPAPTAAPAPMVVEPAQ